MPRMKRSKLGETIPQNGASSDLPSGGDPQDSKPSFFDRLRQMTEQGWDNHLVYVYRRWPRISRSDQPHYIDTVRQAIDEQWLLEHHGSGRYSLRLNDKRRTIDSYVCEVHDLNHPPKVRPEELVDCPENDRYSQLWPQAKVDVVVAEEQLDAGPVATAVRELGKIARERPTLDKTLADLYLQTAKSRDSLVERLAGKPEAGVTDQISSLDKILGLVERLQGREKAVDQLAMFREMLTTVREIRGPTTSKEGFSLLGQAKEMAETVQTFREIFGGPETPTSTGQPAKESEWWQGLLNTKAAESLAASLGQLGTLLVLRTAGPGTVPVAGGNDSTTTAQPRRETPTTVLPTSSPAQPIQPQSLGPQQPGTSTQPPIRQSQDDLMKIAIAQQIFPHVIQALTDGVPGDELAASVFTLNKLAYTQLHARGETGLLEILQAMPEDWSQLQPLESQVRQLIREFIAWNDQEEDGADPESAEPAPEKP